MKKRKKDSELKGIAFFKEDCESDILENITHKIIVFKEQKSEYRLENEDGTEVFKVKLDKGYFQNPLQGEQRCDFLALFQLENQAENAVFIELKGQDWKHALGQILQTIVEIKPNLTDDCVLYARVAGTQKVPNLKADDKYKQLAKPIKLKLNGGTLEIQNTPFTEKIAIFKKKYRTFAL